MYVHTSVFMLPSLTRVHLYGLRNITVDRKGVALWHMITTMGEFSHAQVQILTAADGLQDSSFRTTSARVD